MEGDGEGKKSLGSEGERGKQEILSLSFSVTSLFSDGHLVCVFEKDVCICAYVSASVEASVQKCVCARVGQGVSKIRTVLNSFGSTKNSHEVQLPHRSREDTNELCVCVCVCVEDR